jgi:hypothetical protein
MRIVQDVKEPVGRASRQIYAGASSVSFQKQPISGWALVK